MGLAPNSKLFRAVSSHPGGVRLAIEAIEERAQGEVKDELDNYLRSLNPSTVADTMRDNTFRHMSRSSVDLDRTARIWAAVHALGAEVQTHRLELLVSEAGGRPSPYCSGDFATLQVDAEGLVALDELEYDHARYSHGTHSGLMLATTSAPNSTYWLAGHLSKIARRPGARIRLDPLLWDVKDKFPCMMYFMQVYGQPLDWERIARIRRVEHGRWVGDSPFSKGEITEYAWTPRDGMVHFEIEEVPQQIASGLTSARYLHAIFNPRSRVLEHVDGALRVYTRAQQEARLATHLMDAPKEGARVKAFRVDGEIPLATFSDVASSFFVWNADVQAYFETGGAQAG